MAHLHVRIDSDLEEMLFIRAEELGFENLSQYIRFLLRKEIEREIDENNSDTDHLARRNAR